MVFLDYGSSKLNLAFVDRQGCSNCKEHEYGRRIETDGGRRWQKELDMVQAGKRTGGDRRIYNMVKELKQKVTEGD